MKIYTKTGDKGDSGLFGGARVRKSSARLHAYGTVDELNAVLGTILSEELPDIVRKQIEHVQSLLFIVGSDLAAPDEKANVPRVTPNESALIEGWIDEMEALLPPLQNFILPSGAKTGSLLHHARTICRRAERYTVSVLDEEGCSMDVIIFLNRLSDYLFVAARFVNQSAGEAEKPVILR